MAYLTLVYLMNIPEDAKREAVRLVAAILRGTWTLQELRRVFSEECFSWIKRRKKGVWRMRNRTDFGSKTLLRGLFA